MAFIDYYKIMGIPKDTPQKDIRAAYKKRARLFHPDLHPEDPKAKIKFQMLNEANEVLSDPEKRAKYTSMASSGNRLMLLSVLELRKEVGMALTSITKATTRMVLTLASSQQMAVFLRSSRICLAERVVQVVEGVAGNMHTTVKAMTPKPR